MAKTCRYVYEKHRLIPVFIPMQQSRDGAICKRIKEKTGNYAEIIRGNIPYERVASIISGSRFVIGMRLHILIYSACAGVPAIGLDYDPKVKHMMDYMGQNHSLSVETLSADDLCALCDEVIKNREQLTEKLSKIRENSCIAAEENSDIAIKLLKA